MNLWQSETWRSRSVAMGHSRNFGRGFGLRSVALGSAPSWRLSRDPRYRNGALGEPTGARDPIPTVTVLVWIMTRPPTKGGLLSPRT
jgi:hypothetical protein